MAILTRRTLVIGAPLAVAAAGALPAYRAIWGMQAQETRPIYTENGVALRGTDPVAYFTKSAPVAGAPEYSARWMGATWHFASDANRAAFEAEPEAYAPQYGGFCAWGVAAKGRLFSTLPPNWAIVEGRLFLYSSVAFQASWMQDAPKYMAMGDKRWPEILAAGMG